MFCALILTVVQLSESDDIGRMCMLSSVHICTDIRMVIVKHSMLTSFSITDLNFQHHIIPADESNMAPPESLSAYIIVG